MNDTEWAKPTWQWPTFDAVDYGVELHTDSGQVFSVAWDPPGPQQEGIGLREVPFLGTGISAEANFAVWNVTHRSRWTALIGTTVSDVELSYEPWAKSEGFWCPRITVRFRDARVDMVLGDIGPDGELHPSANNVAVLFSP